MKTILFIEDEMSLQKSLASRLKDEGFEMISALDGEIGLRQAREKMPDLIILDLVLPKKDGFEALKELKSDAGLAPIPVIVLTNLEGSQDVERALSLGAFTYLVKANYSLDDMIEKIKQALGDESRSPTT
ncbi:MAG: Response regulator [Parcubacteria group bacterium GW2011_GWC2_42_13]|nr:MAG: Response regulator [Parcubacteria group bacterium GW2011_GWC2_42_13]